MYNKLAAIRNNFITISSMPAVTSSIDAELSVNPLGTSVMEVLIIYFIFSFYDPSGLYCDLLELYLLQPFGGT
jgi:hypothetical protein